MEIALKMFFKFFMLVVVIASAMVGNVKALPPCCRTEPIECQPITCPSLYINGEFVVDPAKYFGLILVHVSLGKSTYQIYMQNI
ncbi:transmembrane protein, putative [Medicago truncatula]|uniref:Transmembrane protein, putative n=1 Tax=Medicago truncatula TaxID=3880 RepID=G7I277_MEDTR|nr:transmembrane protein, putative [Medicago truncatula]